MSVLDQFFRLRSGLPEGPKLVFLHGVMGYAANWRRIMPAFEDTYDILAYDQRGHGRSFQPESGYGPEDYAQDLKNILEALQWEQVILVGHSMGGRNALHFAYKYPQHVHKLVIEDIGPDANPEGVSGILKILEKVPVPFKDKKLAKEFLYNEFEPVLGAYLYSNIEETKDGIWGWRFYKEGIIESVQEGRKKERWDELRGLKMPTLVLRGERSQDLPLDVFQRMGKENALVKLVEIKNAGHWVHSEQPDEFIQQLKIFLKKTN